jgi:AAA+ superfamily predicted ATPase
MAGIKRLWQDICQLDVLRDRWGFAKATRLFEGFGVLFHGPEGTGRRFAARVLAEALGRSVAVVDARDATPAEVANEILRRPFEDCSPRRFLLHFTNADTLLDGSHPEALRMLLARLDRYPGIVIFSMVSGDTLDESALRRIRYRVPFELPEADLRAVIWSCHFPPKAPLAEDVDQRELGFRYELTGRQIAEAVVIAATRTALRTVDAQDKQMITMADLEAGARQVAGDREQTQ